MPGRPGLAGRRRGQLHPGVRDHAEPLPVAGIDPRSGRQVHMQGVRRPADGRLGSTSGPPWPATSTTAATTSAMAGKFLNRWPLRTPPPRFDRCPQANGGYYDQLWGRRGRAPRPHLLDHLHRRPGPRLPGGVRGRRRPALVPVPGPVRPHDPRVPEPRYAAASFPAWSGSGAAAAARWPGRARLPAPPRWSRPTGEVAAPRTGQARTLLSVDDLVDRVSPRPGPGELDDTLVFYLSDNGYSWGEHRHWASSCPTPSRSRSRSWSAGRGGLPAGTVRRPPGRHHRHRRRSWTRPARPPTPATPSTAARCWTAGGTTAADRVLARPGQRPRRPRLGGPAPRMAVRRELRPAGRRHLPRSSTTCAATPAWSGTCSPTTTAATTRRPPWPPSWPGPHLRRGGLPMSRPRPPRGRPGPTPPPHPSRSRRS